MPNIQTLTLGAYQTNCYLVRAADSKTCAVIDPGYEPETVLGKVQELGLTVDAVLLTHGHFDHVGGVEAIVKATGCALWTHRNDWSLFPNPINKRLYPIANRDFAEVSFCEDQEEITAGGLTFTVFETPGHTAGSVCYLCENALFSGDTLFAGSCGRTDLPGGSKRSLRASLVRLSGFDDALSVYPGHGCATTMAAEKRRNPYL